MIWKQAESGAVQPRETTKILTSNASKCFFARIEDTFNTQNIGKEPHTHTHNDIERDYNYKHR